MRVGKSDFVLSPHNAFEIASRHNDYYSEGSHKTYGCRCLLGCKSSLD